MNQEQARQIMSRNYFGVEEAVKYFGVNPSAQELAVLLKVPFSEMVLKECKDTHLLVAVFPMSIVEIDNKADSLFYRNNKGTVWYKEQKIFFTEERGEVGWYLVRKAPVSDSLSNNFKHQLALLEKNEEAPPARVMTYTVIGHYLATGERLFEKTYVHCKDGDPVNRIFIGCFDPSGYFIGSGWDGTQARNFGLAAVRLPDVA